MTIRLPALRIAVLALATAWLSACTAPFSGIDLTRLWNSQAQEVVIPALEVFAWPASLADDAALEEFVDTIDELNPGLTITLTVAADYEPALAAALTSASPPDVFLTTAAALPELVAAGVVAPISPDWLDPQIYQPAVVEGVSLHGVPYCFPHTVHTLALAYNPALFDRVDLAHPHQNWTWQDLIAAAEAATDADNGLYGLVLAPDLLRWLPFYLQAGGALPGDTGALRFDDEPARLAAETYAGLFAEGFAVEPIEVESSWAGEAFGKGRAAMTIEGSWLVPYLADAFPRLDYGLTDLPAGPSGEASVALVTCIAVNQDSPRRDLAMQLAVQLASAEVLTQWTGDGQHMPVFTAQGQAWLSQRPQAAPFYRGLSEARVWRFGPGVRTGLDDFSSALRLVSAGDLEAAEFWPYLVRNGVVSPLRAEPEVVPVTRGD